MPVPPAEQPPAGHSRHPDTQIRAANTQIDQIRDRLTGRAQPGTGTNFSADACQLGLLVVYLLTDVYTEPH